MPLRLQELCLILPWLLGLGAQASRQVIPLNSEWLFRTTEKDAPTGGICNEPEECEVLVTGPVWRRVDLPHDFILEGAFNESTKDFLHGYLPGGKAWYRRRFYLPRSWVGRKRVVVEFDGVQRNSTTFLNGRRIGTHASGYTSFHYRLDDSSALTYGPESLGEEAEGEGWNVLAVHVDATAPDGWWYDGGGIYRNVRLVVTDLLHIAQWGVYAPSHVTGPIAPSPAFGLTAPAHMTIQWGVYAPSHVTGPITPSPAVGLTAPANMTIQVAVANAWPETSGGFLVSAVVKGPDGQPMHARLDGTARLQAGEERTFEMSLEMGEAALWSLSHPNLYTVAVSLADATTARVIDDVTVSTGVRQVEFHASLGLLLNGQAVKIKGMCNHQDMGGLGVAVPDSLQAYRVWAMQSAIGANAWRTAHNPPSPALLDATDRMGMLVWAENHRNLADNEWLLDLRSMVQRDRNHPSILLWSLCNEALCEGWNVTSATILRDEIRRLDPLGQRAVSAAMNGGYETGFPQLLDVMGFNYNVGEYEAFHAQHPQQPMLGSETSSAYTDRSVYVTDKAKAYVDAYDTNYPPWGNTAEDAWCPIGGHDWMAGGFVWTGFDYKGEPTPYEWPSVASHFGVLDSAGFAKDHAHYYRSIWTATPMVHLLPHWNWDDATEDTADWKWEDVTEERGEEGSGKARGREEERERMRLRGGEDTTQQAPLRQRRIQRKGSGKVVKVWAYSNLPTVELFLNNQSMGRRDMPTEGETGYRCRHAEWEVEYVPGVLEARAYLSPPTSDPPLNPTSDLQYVSHIVTTTGPPTRLEVSLDWPRLQPIDPIRLPGSTLRVRRGEILLLRVSVTDSAGKVVPTANVEVAMKVHGPARILGVANGDPSSHEPDFPVSPHRARRTTFNGLARLIVQVTGQAGQVLIEVSSDNLQAIEPTTLVIDSEPQMGLEAQGVLMS